MIDLDKNIDDLKLLISEKEIKEKIQELSEKINEIFPIDEPLFIICVLKGSFMFFSELIKHLKNNVQVEFIRLSGYGNDLKSSGKIKAIDVNLPDLSEKNVVIVEDIVDTGLTAKFLIDFLNSNHNPKKLIFTSLLNKECSRKIDIKPDLYCFDIDDKFVVGFGLDYKGYFRNLPYIGYFC